MTHMSDCPTCGTLFYQGQEPWRTNKLHCPKHDFLYLKGGECDHCKSERENAQPVEQGQNCKSERENAQPVEAE